MSAKDFHKSPGQIIKNVYDPDNKKIKVDSSSVFKNNNILDQTIFLENILKELRAINFHLSNITNDEINGDDI